MGAIPHKVIAKAIATMGLQENRDGLPVVGLLNSLVNSFTASENGWRNPKADALLGPFRSCLSPNTFRSNRVKNATHTSTGIATKAHSAPTNSIAPYDPLRLQRNTLRALGAYK